MSLPSHSPSLWQAPSGQGLSPFSSHRTDGLFLRKMSVSRSPCSSPCFQLPHSQCLLQYLAEQVKQPACNLPRLDPAVVVFSAAYSEASASSVASEMSSILTSLSTCSLKVFITELFPEPYGPVTAILRISSFAIALSKSFKVLKESSISFNTIDVNAFCFQFLLTKFING